MSLLESLPANLTIPGTRTQGLAGFQLPSGKQPLPPAEQTRVTYSQNGLLAASSLLLASKLGDNQSQQIKEILTKTVKSDKIWAGIGPILAVLPYVAL